MALQSGMLAMEDVADAIESLIFDVIVVGAGSAGCALAARLSADSSRSVLLLEAGADLRSAQLPAIARSLAPNANMFNPELTWPGLTAISSSTQAELPFLRGRGLGGCSLTNAIIAIRPPPEDFSIWEAEGCSTWGWNEVLPFFKRLETDLDYGETGIHGGSGPIPVFRMPRSAWGPADKLLAEASLTSGIPWRDDHNAESGTGVAPYAMNVRAGVRITSNDAYLEPARSRRNLRIVGDAHVDTVLFEGDRAAGVRALVKGRQVDIRSREVALCAGAVHSLAILLRSGIGPSADLNRLSIPVKSSLPVGRNLLDHPVFFIDYALDDGIPAHPAEGRVSSVCVQLTSGGTGSGENDLLMMAWNQAHFDSTGRRGAIGMVLMQSFSRGELTLRSTDPMQHPLIHQRMLSEPSDLERSICGVEWIRDLLHQPVFMNSTSNACLMTLTENGSLRTPMESIDAGNLRSALLAAAIPVGHISGSCRMGADDDPRSVVDHQCQVLGVNGLRVVDCSIMPEIVRVNTHLTATMLGEAMADRMA